MRSTSAVSLVDAAQPIRVAVLASESEARLRYLLADDPNRGPVYELVGGVVNVADSGAARLMESHGIPVEVDDIHEFYDERDAPLEDMAVREAYDARTAEALAEYEPDLVVLAGYLHILTESVLDRYFPAIVNSHHSDLTLRDEVGRPVYTGLRSVDDAIRAGESSTRETTHLVTEDVDRGPIVARSRPFEVHRDLVDDARARGDADLLSAYRYAHRRWMLREGGGRTLAKTVELVADGRVTYGPETEETTIDGTPGFYQIGEGVFEAEQRGADD